MSNSPSDVPGSSRTPDVKFTRMCEKHSTGRIKGQWGIVTFYVKWSDEKITTEWKYRLNPGGGGGLRISSHGNDRMRAKLETQKNPLGFKQNPKNFLDQKLTPKKYHDEFPNLQNSQRAVEDITHNKKRQPRYAGTTTIPRILRLFWISKQIPT